LEAAVGFIGDGALDEGELQKSSDAEIEFAGYAGMSQVAGDLGF